MVRYGTVRYGMAGMAMHGMVWHGMVEAIVALLHNLFTSQVFR